MRFSDIRPFVRYARYLTVSDRAEFSDRMIPCDARLFFVMEGVGKMEINGRHYVANKGSILLIAPGIPYRYGNCEKTKPVRYGVLNFDYTQNAIHQKIPVPPKPTGEFFPEDRLDRSEWDAEEDWPDVIFLEEMHRFSGKLSEIIREYSQNVILNETKISSILTEILVDCARQLRWKTGDRPETPDGILSYIHEHFRQSITNRQLGEVFNFHPNYISTLVKKYTGMPLHKYLNHVRISHALQLLDGGDPSVGEMALECGFCDIYYFSRCFKSVVGVSPSEYRRHRNG